MKEILTDLRDSLEKAYSEHNAVALKTGKYPFPQTMNAINGIFQSAQDKIKKSSYSDAVKEYYGAILADEKRITVNMVNKCGV